MVNGPSIVGAQRSNIFFKAILFRPKRVEGGREESVGWKLLQTGLGLILRHSIIWGAAVQSWISLDKFTWMDQKSSLNSFWCHGRLWISSFSCKSRFVNIFLIRWSIQRRNRWIYFDSGTRFNKWSNIKTVLFVVCYFP